VLSNVNGQDITVCHSGCPAGYLDITYFSHKESYFTGIQIDWKNNAIYDVKLATNTVKHGYKNIKNNNTLNQKA